MITIYKRNILSTIMGNRKTIMKKLIIIMFILILNTLNAFANEPLCLSEHNETLNQLEQQLNNCNVDYGDNYHTDEMLAAYTKAENCLKTVAYTIFDKYYTKKNLFSKEIFDNHIKIIRDFNYNLIQGSDWATDNKLAETYVLEAEGAIFASTKKIIIEYIDELRHECIDIVD